jgi:hypothetical protein
VPPIHIEAFAERRLDADISVADNRVRPQRPQIVLDDGEAAIEAERMKALRDHRRVGVRVLLEQLGDGRFPAIDFAGAFPTGGAAPWVHRYFAIVRRPMRRCLASSAATTFPPSGADAVR